VIRAIIDAAGKRYEFTEEELREIEKNKSFYLKWAYFVEIYPDKGRERIEESVSRDVSNLYSMIDKWHKATVDNSKEYSIDYMAKHNKDYNENVAAREKFKAEKTSWVERHVSVISYIGLCRGQFKTAGGEPVEEAKNLMSLGVASRTAGLKYMFCLSYLKTRYPDIE